MAGLEAAGLEAPGLDAAGLDAGGPDDPPGCAELLDVVGEQAATVRPVATTLTATAMDVRNCKGASVSRCREPSWLRRQQP